MEDKSQIAAMFGGTATFPLVLGIISGILYLGNFVLMRYNIAKNGIVMSSTFMKLGVLVPAVMAVAVFHEIPRWTQVLGILIAAAAIVLINFEKEALSEGKKKAWLLILLLVSGITEGMASIYEKLGDANLKDGYLLITFSVAFVFAVILAIRDGKAGIKDALFGAIIGVPNYYFSRFLLAALSSIDAVIVYPIGSVTSIIAITIIGVVVFKENLSKKKVCALALIIAALVFLNI